MGQAAPEYDVDTVVARLKHAAKRITQTVAEARACDATWRVLAYGGDVRKAVAASPAALAAYVYEKATRDNQIVMITRLLDQPSRRGAFNTNRLSFPVCRDLLALAGVIESLRAEARAWPSNEPERNAAIHEEEYQNFLTRLQSLESEEPNRAARLRSFRDENIAHELHFAELPPRPVVRDLHDLIVEETRLIESLAMVVDGTNIVWDMQDHAGSAEALWKAVASAL